MLKTECTLERENTGDVPESR